MVHVELLPASWGIWRIPGRHSSAANRKPERLIASRWNDQQPAYSPDGHRIAFSSDRTGFWSVWVGDEDGRDPIQLTTFDASIQIMGTPWSPDGRRLVFVSLASGNWDLYLVDSEGGKPRRLTHEPTSDMSGSFSRDGRFIYFTSDRGGRNQIWKMSVDGGAAVQVTRGDGFYVQESWDARSVYYSMDREIWRVPVEGGEGSPVLRVREGGYISGWDVSRFGIYHATSRWSVAMNEEFTVQFLDFETGRTEMLFRTQGPFEHSTLRVSPDEKWILYSERPVPQSDLMLIENFR
jgi:Tol biopolymer transport system component